MSISTSLQASVHGWALIQCSGLPVAGVPQAKQGVAHGRRVAVPAGGGEVVCPRVRGACAILPVPSSEANSGEARGLRGAGFTGFRWLRSSAFGRGVTCGERKLLTLGSAKSFLSLCLGVAPGSGNVPSCLGRSRLLAASAPLRS